MTLPGFSADSALYRSSNAYRSSWKATPLAGAVEMQLWGETSEGGIGNGTKCGGCSSSGWQKCKTEDGSSYTQACTSCSPCLPNLTAGWPYPYQYICVTGGKSSTHSCQWCTTYKLFAWWIEVDCYRVCKPAWDSSTWTTADC